MSHAAELDDGAKLPEAPSPSGFVGGLLTLLRWIDEAILRLSMIALLLASVVLTYSAVVRYFFKVPTDWQDEMAVFLLAGATFLSAPYVQSVRGHIAIEAIRGFLPKPIERVRKLLSDLICFAFCAFFAWQSWLLLLEAIEDGRVTDSAWAPPLWFPYSMMTVGMSLLALRFLVQIAQALFGRREAGA